MNTATSLSLLVVLAACASAPDRADEAPRALRDETRVAGQSVRGRPIEYRVLGDGAETVMILASIHGSEPAGTPLVDAFLVHVERRPEIVDGKRLVVVPVVNPDGYAERARHNANGVDLNRNFPAANRQNRERFGTEGLSEPESRAIHALLERYAPARIVSIHQPLACVDYDGPAGKIAAAMADHCDLPVRRLGSRPGSLGSFAGVDLRIPIVTFELRKGEEELGASGLWAKYGAALMAFVCFGDAAPRGS